MKAEAINRSFAHKESTVGHEHKDFDEAEPHEDPTRNGGLGCMYFDIFNLL